MAASGLLKVDHVACGCRPHLSMCGTYRPHVKEIEFYADQPAEDDGEPVSQWCQDCLVMWHTHGCGSCGCRATKLCWICVDTLQSATDRP